MKVRIYEEYVPTLLLGEDENEAVVGCEDGVEIPDDVVRIIRKARELDHAVHLLLCRYERD